MQTKNNKSDGFMEQVKTFIQGDKAKKSKLIDWLNKAEKLEAESAELERLEETLPGEIDQLLASGKMDDQTIAALAKNRAMLDLVPARQDKIADAISEMDREFEDASALVEQAVRKASEIFFDRQLEAAVADLKKLGVSDEIARKQAVLREDLQAIEPLSCAIRLNSFTQSERARKLLAAFEAFEAGLHPFSPDAAEFEARWLSAK